MDVKFLFFLFAFRFQFCTSVRHFTQKLVRVSIAGCWVFVFLFKFCGNSTATCLQQREVFHNTV